MAESWGKHLPGRLALSPLIGVFTSDIGGLNQWVHIWAYKSLDERVAVRKKAMEAGIWPPPGARQAEPDDQAGDENPAAGAVLADQVEPASGSSSKAQRGCKWSRRACTRSAGANDTGAEPHVRHRPLRRRPDPRRHPRARDLRARRHDRDASRSRPLPTSIRRRLRRGRRPDDPALRGDARGSRPLPAAEMHRAHGRRLRPARPRGRGRAQRPRLQRARLRHDRGRRSRDRARARACGAASSTITTRSAPSRWRRGGR